MLKNALTLFRLEKKILKNREEEDELSMISRRVNQLWKSKQRKFRGFRSSKRFEHGESSGDRRSDKKKAVCYECNEPGHYKNECPKLQKENPKKKFHKKKSLMATWDDSEDESDLKMSKLTSR